MSEKDYILARLDILKIFVSALFGAILIAFFYVVQILSSLLSNIIIMIIMFIAAVIGAFIICISLRKPYSELLNK
ncbi:MAG: hypothetical protein K8S27_10915, partial [Candidatus Omnitrophica bacterium]|nr:hypothetical protein [Candidatus Omnitrophota bacterium]